MLKRYESSDRIQWVGRAWEVRHALRQEVKRRGGGTRLGDVLAERDARMCAGRGNSLNPKGDEDACTRSGKGKAMSPARQAGGRSRHFRGVRTGAILQFPAP